VEKRNVSPDWGWLLQAATGLGLLILGSFHIVAQHFTSQGLMDSAAVKAWLRQPWVFAIETLFLVAVVIHAALGVRSILLDLGLAPATERKINKATLMAAILLMSYGAALTTLLVIR